LTVAVEMVPDMLCVFNFVGSDVNMASKHSVVTAEVLRERSDIFVQRCSIHSLRICGHVWRFCNLMDVVHKLVGMEMHQSVVLRLWVLM